MERIAHSVITFENIISAMAFEKKAGDVQLKGRMIPLPSEIGEGCGLCFAAKTGQDEKLGLLLDRTEYLKVYDRILLY